MLRKQLNGRKASIRMYKELLEPYVKAMRKIRFSETEMEGLDDPTLVEGYDTSVAGVELFCWKGISDETSFEYEERPDEFKEGRYPFYCFMDINIKRKSLTVSGKRKVKMIMQFRVYLKTGKEIEEIKKKIKERKELIWKELDEFRGGEWDEEKPEEIEKRNKILESMEKAIRALAGMPSAGRFHMPKGTAGKIQRKIQNEFYSFYDEMKDIIGGFKFARH